MTTTRLGLVGAGAIAELHLSAIEHLAATVQLSAICDSRPEAIARVLQRFPGAEGFTHVGAMIDSGLIDAGVVATPHFLHFDQAALFAKSGKPVLVEKPLSLSTAQLRELDALVRTGETGAIVAGQSRRFEPDVVATRDWMSRDSTTFGELAMFQIQSMQDISAYTATAGATHWLLDGNLAGGGVGFSLAVHQIDVVRFLTGTDYAEVFAFQTLSRPFTNGAESQLAVSFRMSNGAIGTLQASYVAPRIPFVEGMTLLGTHGSVVQHVEKPGDYRGPISIASSAGAQPKEFADQLSGWEQITPVAGLHELSFVNQLDHFCRAVAGETEWENTLRVNFNTIACLEAVRLSATTGAPVEVDRW